MARHTSSERIIVIGASAGGVDGLRDLMAGLPPDLHASLFVVLHLPVTSKSSLPDILTRVAPFGAKHPDDGERIRSRCIYVAPPDHHLLLERRHVVVKKGPKENRFRPSIDALFRSAAYVYGPQVIGVVLSEMLDDGTSGLWSVKRMGGISIVQDPKSTAFDSMPLSAIEHVDIDHVVDARTMGPLLGTLAEKPVKRGRFEKLKALRSRMATEISIATSNDAFKKGIMKLGDLTPFTCPECHGVLVSLKEGLGIRFRCHTGHAYSANALLAGVMEMVDEYNWQHIRALEESVMLLKHVGGHLKTHGQADLAKVFFSHADESEQRGQYLHQQTLTHENISGDRLRAEVDEQHARAKKKAGKA